METQWVFFNAYNTRSLLVLNSAYKGIFVKNRYKLSALALCASLLIGCGGGTGTTSYSSQFAGITTDGQNPPVSLYITDFGLNVVETLAISNGAISPISGNSSSAGSANGVGTAAQFNGPEGIVLSGGSLYVVDTQNNGVRALTSATATATVSTLAGKLGTPGKADGTGVAATFTAPRFAVSDGANLYVTDTGNNTIRKIVISSGVVTTLAGGFNVPFGIVIDAGNANLYVANAGDNTIKKVSLTAPYPVTPIAGNLAGSYGFVDDTNGSNAKFSTPSGIATDGTNLYVADYYNHAIRQISLTAPYAVITIAGKTDGTYGSADNAVGTSATLYYPLSLTYANNALYVIDQNGGKIRKVTTNGTNTVTTIR